MGESISAGTLRHGKELSIWQPEGRRGFCSSFTRYIQCIVLDRPLNREAAFVKMQVSHAISFWSISLGQKCHLDPSRPQILNVRYKRALIGELAFKMKLGACYRRCLVGFATPHVSFVRNAILAHPVAHGSAAQYKFEPPHSPVVLVFRGKLSPPGNTASYRKNLSGETPLLNVVTREEVQI